LASCAGRGTIVSNELKKWPSVVIAILQKQMLRSPSTTLRIGSVQDLKTILDEYGVVAQLSPQQRTDTKDGLEALSRDKNWILRRNAVEGLGSAAMGAAVGDENYFDTMKTAIISGRGFTTDDKAGARRGAVVNAEFANTYWPRQDPIGKRLRLNDSNGPWVEVVGVTKTNKYWFIAEPPCQYFYLPFAQEPSTRMSLVVETDGDPAAVAAPLREVVRTLDPNQPIYNVRTLSSFYEQRAISIVVMVTEMVAIMGLLGLTLALVGLYGLIAYSVSRRRQEIGIRIAIGASKAEVVKLVLRQGLALVLGGMLAGGAISFAVARMLTAGLVGLGTPNPLTYVVVPVALVVVTMAACYIPARRASLIDPIRALRCE